MGSDTPICEKGGSGLLLPLGGDGEQEWPNGLRVILYLMGLGWLFMGVAIVADVFMASIEKITSKKTRKLVDPMKNKYVTVTVWNATVANLTLMALGSSAPEILLNVIDIFASGFMTGALGPFTIVGSAAFNLLCITAVCVVAIPGGETRIIKEFEVYVITAVFSVFAYLWLLVILMGTSENLVDVWEGVLTFLFFPVLVELAFLADKGYFSKNGGTGAGKQRVVTADMTKEELADVEATVRKLHGAHLTDEQVLKIIEIEYSPPASRAAQRVAATRALTGGKRVKVTDQSKANQTSAKVMPQDDVEDDKAPKLPIVMFEGPSYAVLEGAGKIEVPVVRRGELMERVTVGYATREGSATAGSDFQHREGHLVFEPGVERQVITIPIIDDTAYEDDEDFFVDLKEEANTSWKMGPVKTATITIIDDDLPGELHFKDDSFNVEEGMEDKQVDIIVHRSKGSSGKIGCKYATENDSAIAGVDYESASGTLEFENGVLTAKITLTIKAVGRYDRVEDLRLIISDVTGGAKVNPEHDGGDKGVNILTIMINPNGDIKNKIDRMNSSLQASWDKAKVGHANWRDQFISAVKVNGADGDDDEEAEGSSPSVLDYVMHVITCPWKLLFACCPPVDYCGGWLCFVCSLSMIGAVTAVIGDMAGLLGCTMGISDKITAITFVALGTSLPDTFASKSAAAQDPYADAAICNVTGSNSVNVFLGLGLPWMLGAIYWVGFGANDEYKEKYYGKSWAPSGGNAVLVVEAGDLGTSVSIFCACAVCCIFVLYLRRVFLGGELGGPPRLKWGTAIFFVSLWFLYIALSCVL